MNVLKAAQETIELWEKADHVSASEPSLSLKHAGEMLVQMHTPNFSYGKLCRWLGWMQAACVANGVASLDDMKEINKRNREDVPVGGAGQRERQLDPPYRDSEDPQNKDGGNDPAFYRPTTRPVPTTYPDDLPCVEKAVRESQTEDDATYWLNAGADRVFTFGFHEKRESK